MAMRVEGEFNPSTETKRGVRQRCVVSPELLNIYSEMILREINQIEAGMGLVTKKWGGHVSGESKKWGSVGLPAAKGFRATPSRILENAPFARSDRICAQR